MRQVPLDKRLRTCIRVSIVLLAAVVLSCCVLPDLLFRVKYGRPPLSAEKYRTSLVTGGMTADEVRAALGEPHEIHPAVSPEDEEVWFYHTDLLGPSSLGVNFGPDKRVTGTWIP